MSIALSPVQRLKMLGTGVARAGRSLGACLEAAATGQWEGWETSRFRRRPTSRLAQEDTDLDLGTREKMLAEARALCQTFPIARYLPRKIANYVVGDLQVKWNTGDSTIDAAYAAYWKSWMKRADAKGVHHFKKLTKLAVQGMIRDGDMFAQKVLDNGRLYVGMIEADRVGNIPNGGILNIDTDNCRGGVVINTNGAPIAYRVSERVRFGYFKNPKDLPKSEIFHLFDTDRADACRGVTHFMCVLNALRDLKEIIDAEKTGVKVNSKIALLVKTVTGAAAAANVWEDDGNDVTNPDAPSIKAQEVHEGMMAYMFPQEDMKAHESNRPSGAWVGFVDFMVQLIALGLDMPYGFVWKMVGGGPAVRFDAKQAEKAISSIQDELEQKWLDPIIGSVISVAIANGEVPESTRWFDYNVRRPAFASIDAGRDVKAGLDEIRMSATSTQAYVAEDGGDAFQVARENAEFEKHVQELAKEFKVDPERIRCLGINELQPDQAEVSGEESKPASEGRKPLNVRVNQPAQKKVAAIRRNGEGEIIGVDVEVITK